MIERFNEPIQLTNKLESSQRGGRCDRHKNNLNCFSMKNTSQLRLPQRKHPAQHDVHSVN